MKILITGGSGQVGGELIRRLDQFTSPEDRVYLLHHKTHINVEEIKNRYAQVVPDKMLYDNAPYDLAIHLAANLHTKFGKDPNYLDRFREDNVLLTHRVSEVSERVILASTDQVFRGDSNEDYKENDPTDPYENHYGQTKREAEEFVLKNKKGEVIRFETMLGVPKNLIVDRAYDALDGNPYFPFWNNRCVKPTHFYDFIPSLIKIMARPGPAIYHVACKGYPLSRAQYAQKVLEIHLHHKIPIKNGLINEEEDNSDFPRRLSLDTDWTKKTLGLEFMSVDEAIEKHILATRKKHT